MKLSRLCRSVAASTLFQVVIVVIIVVNAVAVGLETSKTLTHEASAEFAVLNAFVLSVYVLEIVVKLLAGGRKPWEFFRDGWNCFDLAVIVVSLIPEIGTFATIARLVRVVRVLRVISILPELRMIVTALVRSLPAVGNVGFLVGLLLYVYGVIGYHLFHDVDHGHWGSLGRSLLSLLQIMTLDSWSVLENKLLPARPYAWIYFGSFIVLAVYIVINLFIAIVIGSLESARAEHQARADRANPQRALLRRIDTLRAELEQFEHIIRGMNAPEPTDTGPQNA